MGRLRAAAGEVDLEPPAGCWLSGFAARTEPSTGVHDPIMARAVLLDDGAAALAVVSCDLIGFTAQTVARIRERITAATDGAVPAANVLIACTHTHSAPASLPFHGVLGRVDGAWLQAVTRKIVDLVAGLPSRLAPARVATGSRTVTGLGHNRQDPSHPLDERLRLIAVDADDGPAIATIVNYATHAIALGPSNLLVSADYPGEVVRGLAGSRGGIALFLQGACGDVDPLLYRERGWGTGTFDDARDMGGRLAEAALAALAGAAWSNEPGIKIERETLDIPLDLPPSPQQLQDLVDRFEADRRKARARPDGRRDELIAEAMLDWAADARPSVLANAAALDAVALDAAARSVAPGRPMPPTIPAELFVAAVADARIVGVPFEAYSGLALEIARALHPLTTVFVGYANGDLGYCPTRQAKDQGGYGPVDSSRWYPHLASPIGYGADELIVARATALAKG